MPVYKWRGCYKFPGQTIINLERNFEESCLVQKFGVVDQREKEIFDSDFEPDRLFSSLHGESAVIQLKRC